MNIAKLIRLTGRVAILELKFRKQIDLIKRRKASQRAVK